MGICNRNTGKQNLQKKVVTGHSKSFGSVSPPYSSCEMDFQMLLGQFEGLSKMLKLYRGATVITPNTTKIIPPSTGVGMVVKMAPSLPIIPIKIINTPLTALLPTCQVV